MRNRELRTGILATALILATGALACATNGSSAVLEDHLRRYNQYIRWSDYDRASQFVDPELQADFRARGDAMSGVRFTDYEVRRFDVDHETEEAHVEVWYTAYHTRHLVEVAFVEEQDWARDEVTGAWRVRSVLREQPATARTPF